MTTIEFLLTKEQEAELKRAAELLEEASNTSENEEAAHEEYPSCLDAAHSHLNSVISGLLPYEVSKLIEIRDSIKDYTRAALDESKDFERDYDGADKAADEVKDIIKA